MKRQLVILICLISTVACSKKSSDSTDQAASVTSYVVKGDPHLLLKGVQMRPDSIFSSSNILELNDYSLTAMASFFERAKAKTSSSETNLEGENAASDGSAHKTYKLQVSQADANSYAVDIQGIGARINFQTDVGGSLQIGSIIADGEIMPMNVLHWSQTSDKGFISVLMDYTDSQSGRTLLAMYFQKSAAQLPRMQVDKKYAFLDGPGIITTWDISKTLTFEVCGDTTALQNTANAMSYWQSILFNRLNIVVKKASNPAPFSDLNQHCLYMVDTYISDPRTDVANYGITIPILDRARGQIVDSDVILFRAEFDKLQTAALQAGYTQAQYNQSVLPFYMNYTIIHELGHVLGLDHQFDGTASIMSYKFQVSQPTTYDRNALQALYASFIPQPIY